MNIYNKLTLSNNSDYKLSYTSKDNICFRCGNEFIDTVCVNCSELGQVSSDDIFYQDTYSLYPINYIDQEFNISFTDLQLGASQFLLNSYKTKEDSLIWAVCGAGKTEITFNLIKEVIKENKYVCFAIPRVDIVFEIYERIKEVFNTEVSIMCGDKKDNLNAQIYIMTTNQILKFNNCFSLIIIDEVDAFPYEHNIKYDYAVNRAKRDDGVITYLTSTPSSHMLSKSLNTFTINRRWHGYDLPVPILKKVHINLFNNNLIPLTLYSYLNHRKLPCILFISNIEFGKVISNVLSKYGYKNLFVSSKEEKRQEYINIFKDNKVDILISTAILERGVTFNNIDVIVLDSDSTLYNVASLVQISGRVGRKKEYQEGKVYFYYNYINNTINTSIKQIKYMNDR